MSDPEPGGSHHGEWRFSRLGRMARREPVAWLTLIVIIAVSFAATSFFVRRYRAKRIALGRDWYAQGQTDLRAGHAAAAVEAFRNSLGYRPDDASVEFALAEALAAQNRTGEAESYFLALWQMAPQSGPVNINLARLAARDHRGHDVIRYYHNAIFGIWPADGVEKSLQARRELIRYLLANKSPDEADSELLAEIRELPPLAAAYIAAGRDFLAANDAAHALTQFRTALRLSPDNGEALAGAGEAAYRQGNYGLAHRYLARAAVRLPRDATVAERLATATAVLSADPFAYHLSTRERRDRALRDLATAQARLHACAGGAARQGRSASAWAALLARAKALASRPRARFFRDANAIPNTMAFIFAVEEETEQVCSPPTGNDLALLLLAHVREATAP